MAEGEKLWLLHPNAPNIKFTSIPVSVPPTEPTPAKPADPAKPLDPKPVISDNMRMVFKALIEILKIFSHGSLKDKFLALLGVLATVVHALCFLALALILGKITEPFVQLTLADVAPDNSSLQTGSSSLFGIDWILGNNAPSQPLNPAGHTFLNSMKLFTVDFIYIGVVVLISSFLQCYLFEWSAENQVFKLRTDYVNNTLRQELGYFKDLNAADVSYTLADSAQKLREGIGHKFSMVLQFGTICAVQIGFALYTNWKLTMIFLTISPLPAFIVKFFDFGKMFRRSDEDEQDIYAEAATAATTAVQNMKLIMTFNKESFELDRYRETLHHAERVANQNYTVQAFGIGLFIVLLFGSYGFAFQHACKLMAEHSVTTTELFTIFFTVTIAVFAVGQVLPWITTILSAWQAAQTLEEVLSLGDPGIDGTKEPTGNNIVNPTGQFKFENVSFAYKAKPGTTAHPPQVLDKFEMEILPGKTIGLIGYAGTGKTTIANLMARFYDLQDGQITIDGAPLRSLDVCWVRSKVAIVPQEPPVFQEASVMTNLCAGSQIYEDIVVETAKFVGIHDSITKLKHGYNTIIGINTWSMDEEQKYRLGLVRALLRNPTWLVLDQTLDHLMDGKEILKEIRKRHPRLCTLLISNKTKTLKDTTDKIYYLEGGKAESGTYAELLKAKGGFFKMQQDEVDLESYAIGGILSSFIPKKDAEVDKIVDEAERLKQVYPGFWKMLEMTNRGFEDWSGWGLALVGCCLTGLIIPAFALYYVDIFLAFGKISKNLYNDSELMTNILFVFAGIAGLGYLLRSLFVQISGERLVLNLRMRIFENILERPLPWFDKKENSVGTVTTKLTEGIPAIKAALSNRFSIAISGFFSVLGAIVLSLLLGWQLSFAIIFCVQIILFLAGLQIKWQRKVERVGVALLEQSSQVFKGAIEQIWTIQAYSEELTICQKYVNRVGRILSERLASCQIFALMFGFSECFIYILIGFTFRYGCYLMETDAIAPICFFRLYLVLLFCMISFGISTSFIPDYSKAELAFARVVDLLEAPGDLEKIRVSPRNETFNISGAIKFDNVAFTYPGKFPILRDCSFEIPAGKLVVIACFGAETGLTTLLNLILRLYEVDAGHIFIDNEDIQNLEINQARANMGFVPQEPNLLKLSIFDNIAYGYGRSIRRETLIPLVEEAARTVELEEFISGASDHYQTIVDESTPGFTRLVRMKIAIARAIIRDPKILLLDEPTEGFTAADEIEMMKLIQKLRVGRTCVVTTKQAKMALLGDLVAMFQCQKFTEFGSNADLAKDPEQYRDYAYLMEQLKPPPILEDPPPPSEVPTKPKSVKIKH